MLDSVMQYITQAVSSYAFIFCFCNLIIVIILVDLKPKLNFNEANGITVSMPTNTAMQGANSKCLVNNNTAKEEVAVEKVESSEEDDELRRRVEEFIDRVNEGWKAEYVSTSSLLRDSNDKEFLESEF